MSELRIRQTFLGLIPDNTLSDSIPMTITTGPGDHRKQTISQTVIRPVHVGQN
jgi:hypothetical protein